MTEIVRSGELAQIQREREATKRAEEAHDRAAYAAHVAHAQNHGDLTRGAMSLAMDEDGAVYSVAADRSGLTLRCSEAGSTEVKSLWIPSNLYTLLRAGMLATEEDAR